MKLRLKPGFVFFVFLCFFPLTPSTSSAVRPFFITEDAIPIERGKSRLETGISFQRYDSDDRRFPWVVDFTQGVINNLDFGVSVPVIFKSGRDSSDGIGDIRIKSKLRFLKGREANPLSLSSQLFIKFPSCDRSKNLSPECTGEPDVGLIGIASKEFFPILVHLNLGYVLTGNPNNQSFRDVFQYSLAFDILTVIDPLHVIAELAGETQRNPSQPTDSVAVQFGALYQLISALSIDGSFGFGLTDASPDVFVNTGVTYRF
ncbi:MAG TPA: transporter [Nitrospiria bacterium]